LDTNKPEKVMDDVVVSMDYSLTVDGEVIDSSDDNEPLEFLQGHKNIIPGLERELYGMAVGDSKEVTVLAQDAYGPFDPDAVVEVSKDEFPPDIPLEEDVQLQVRDVDGRVMDARISEIKDTTVTLDFNHPLAGEDLHFIVKVVDLRQATPEELEHGHVHGEHDEEEFDEEEYEEYDFEDGEEIDGEE
jgi:FKBP-type peptidyl-prolyl cis-trans isomerase SlyD